MVELGRHFCRGKKDFVRNALLHSGEDRKRCAMRLGKYNVAKLQKYAWKVGNFKLVTLKKLEIKSATIAGTK